MLNNTLNYVIVPFLLNLLIYWTTCGYWFYHDFNGSKGRIYKTIDWKLYKKTIVHVISMQFLLVPFVLYTIRDLWELRTSEDLFTFETAAKLVICPCISEFVFFYTHSIGHTKFWYKHVHHIHHEWKYPCGVSAAYSHPIEFIFSLLPTLILPPLVLNINWNAALIYFSLAIISVVNSHSGYMNVEGSERHTLHHIKNNFNLGPMRILDNLYKTEYKILN